MAESKETSQTETDELNDLLQSALEDFDKCPSTSSEATETVVKKPAAKKVDPAENFEQKFKDLLLNDVDESDFANKMTDLLQEFQNEATKPDDKNIAAPDEGGDAVSEAVKSLVENIEEIKDTMGPDQFLNNVDFGDFKNDGVFPVMEQMFQMIMSKEVLYPSLVAVRDKYPSWLQENRSKISAEEGDRYDKQYKIIDRICILFENENDTDPEDIKQKRFMELLALLQEMTELGQPPKDFSESLPSVPMNSNFFNSLPTDMEPNNCNMM